MYGLLLSCEVIVNKLLLELFYEITIINTNQEDSISQVSSIGKAIIRKTKLKDMSHQKVSSSNSCKLDRNLQTSSNIYVLEDILKREDLQSRAII